MASTSAEHEDIMRQVEEDEELGRPVTQENITDTEEKDDANVSQSQAPVKEQRRHIRLGSPPLTANRRRHHHHHNEHEEYSNSDESQTPSVGSDSEDSGRWKGKESCQHSRQERSKIQECLDAYGDTDSDTGLLYIEYSAPTRQQLLRRKITADGLRGAFAGFVGGIILSYISALLYSF